MDTPEQAQLRRHLSELRRATAGLGKDFSIEIQTLGTKIDRLGALTGKEARNFAYDIEDDFANLGHSVRVEAKKLPGEIASGAVKAGVAIGSGVSRFAGATKDTLTAAGKKASEGTKNTLASLAGVRRTPMKEWRPPGDDESP
jgi:hypothetical protein